MSDETIIKVIFACIDDLVKDLAVAPHPGPAGHLSLIEILTLMLLQPVLKPDWTLKGYWRGLSQSFS